jgi:hypothetical protein
MAGLRASMNLAQVDILMGTPNKQAISGNRLVTRYGNHPTLSEEGELVQWGLESRFSRNFLLQFCLAD